jgi:RNA polymerase sigma-70 factor (ECF subfamily)
MNQRPGEEDIVRAFRDHYEAIMGYAFRMTGNRDEAEDVASHVFLALAEQGRRGAMPPALRPWLFRSASNHIISQARRRVVRAAIGGELWRWLTRNAECATPSRALQETGRADRIRAALHRLSFEDRQVIVLRYDEELEFEQIAEITGLTVGSVRSRLSRALDRLRLIVHEEGTP